MSHIVSLDNEVCSRKISNINVIFDSAIETFKSSNYGSSIDQMLKNDLENLKSVINDLRYTPCNSLDNFNYILDTFSFNYIKEKIEIFKSKQGEATTEERALMFVWDKLIDMKKVILSNNY